MITESGKRNVSIDVLRGLTIAGMIFVNMPGSWEHNFHQLHHSPWHGFTFADLIFPLFLFVMGLSAWYSFQKYGVSLNPEMWRRIVKRSALLFLVGILLNTYPFYMALEDVRIMGVLQRIALVYAIGSILILSLSRKWLLITSGGILIAYWVLLSFYGDNPYSMEGSMVLSIDSLILGKTHLYQGLGQAFDPEGLLSTLPAIVNMTAGYFTASVLSTSKQKKSSLLLAGSTLTVVGILWNFIFPVNKSLWTSSYVLLTVGLSIIIITVLDHLLKDRKEPSWTIPFVSLGANPLIIYGMSILYANTIWMFVLPDREGNSLEGYDWVFQMFFKPIAGEQIGSLLFSIFHVILFLSVAVLLYRKRIFIRL